MKVVGLALVAMLISGCSGLLRSNAQAEQTYVLRGLPGSAASTQPLNAPSLRLGRTIAAPGLEADRIVLVRSDRRMDYYASSRWAAPIPDVVEDLVAEALRGSGKWSSVHDSRGAFSGDYYLQLDIRRFEADYTEGTQPKVHVVIGCSVGRRSERLLLANFTAEGSAQASANRLGEVVAAFESAVQAALATIVEKSNAALLEAEEEEKPAPG